MLKTVLHSHEPLQWKGGRLFPLYKGKGQMGDVTKYRSILVSNHLGKAVHKTIRFSTYSAFSAFLHASQLGGRKAAPVTLRVHYARAFVRHLKTSKLAGALVMLDLKEAFYRIFRALAMSHDWSDERLAHFFASLGLPSSALADLRCALQQPPSLSQAGLAPHLRQAVSAIHQQTWFSTPGQSDIARTTRGTRPGDSFADTIFSFVFARVLHDISRIS